MPQEIPMALDAIIKQPITEHEAPPAILARLAAIGATVNMGRLSSVVLPSALAVLVHALRAIEGPAWEATAEAIHARAKETPDDPQAIAHIHSQDETWLGAIANLGFGGMLSDVTSDTLQLLSQGCFHIMHRWPWASMSATLLPTLWTVLRAVLSDEALACNLSFANEDLRNIIEAFSNGHLDWHTRISASGVLTALAQCSHHHDLLPELCGLYTVELATVSVERLEFLHAIFSGLCEAFADTRANELVASTGLMSVMHKCVEQLRAMERGASPEAAEGIEACCNLAQQFSELKSQQ
ncbi:uncharacterized protein MONBRDRAFT_32334 [Monosiga brevicollis MX1]|uniref:Uncharacterized protein n=1 Tax=Monosiga brevicollis TaxID=81824 RepID=A9UYV5_MONBE|nr:uncharacterized protein MONBRDRAFT_32334 [Monosiga brevicollis MX1]EDQ89526.1 predicted protein [Monosiga brevicollis MX1]|eukprot:XP_001745555.1 hypothetical protein [Monosiga brevicollis MX1]